MRYKVTLWPMMGETLGIVNVFFEHYERGTDYRHQFTLKTEGDSHWPLPDLLRELADQWEARVG